MLLGRFAITAGTFHVSFSLEEVHFGAYLNANEAKHGVSSSARRTVEVWLLLFRCVNGSSFQGIYRFE